MAWSGTWRDVFDDVAAAGYDTVAFDVPPFGFSERPADHDYSRRAQAEHIRATIDTLGIGPVVLVGHSFGGAATVEAAMQEDPSRVIGLALLDAALGLLDPQPSGPPMPWLFAAEPVRNVVMACSFTNPWAIGPGLRAFTFDPANVTDERIALYREPLVLAGTTEAIGHWFVDGLFGDPEGSASSTPEAYRSFARPVLLVWGREDSVTPLAQGAHLHGLFPSSELVILDEVNHIPHVEAPERTLAHLLAFLERVRGD